MASPLQYGEASQFFELESSCSWIIVAIQWNKYDKLTFNLDHFKGAGQYFIGRGLLWITCFIRENNAFNYFNLKDSSLSLVSVTFQEHLDQAGCDYFVGHLVHINSSRFLRSQIGMERIFPLTKYLSFNPVCFRKRFIHYLILMLHSSVVIPMIVIISHHRSFRITEG